MGLLKCLSPRASSMREKDLHSELRQVKAQLAEAKITIADLKEGCALEGRIGTSVAPTKTSVAVQAKPPVECESRIPRHDDGPALRPSAHSTPRVSMHDVCVSTSAVAGAGNAPPSPGALRSPKGGVPKSPKAGKSSPSPTRSMWKSRIPASPSPDGVRRSQSARHAAAAAAAAPAAPEADLPARTLAEHLSSDGGCSSQTSSDAGASAAAASSSQVRAEFLSNQLKVAEAFRQSLEGELRDLRFKNAGLQTQVLSLQTKLERSVEAQVDELGRIEQLRKNAGSTDSRGYEEAVSQLAALKRRLEDVEADKTVAEQQAKAATELAASHQEALAATQAELAGLKAELGSAQAKVHELSAEGARLKAALRKASKAQARVEELEGELAALKAAAAAAEADACDKVSKVHTGTPEGDGSWQQQAGETALEVAAAAVSAASAAVLAAKAQR